MPKIAGHRLAQRQQADDEGLDLALQRIDLRILLHRAGGGCRVAVHDRIGGEGDLGFHDAAHLRHHVAQPLQLLVVAFDEMLRRFGHGCLRQPNRPVMYSWVRRSLGAVNIWPAGATSTISPR